MNFFSSISHSVIHVQLQQLELPVTVQVLAIHKLAVVEPVHVRLILPLRRLQLQVVLILVMDQRFLFHVKMVTLHRQ